MIFSGESVDFLFREGVFFYAFSRKRATEIKIWVWNPSIENYDIFAKTYSETFHQLSTLFVWVFTKGKSKVGKIESGKGPLKGPLQNSSVGTSTIYRIREVEFETSPSSDHNLAAISVNFFVQAYSDEYLSDWSHSFFTSKHIRCHLRESKLDIWDMSSFACTTKTVGPRTKKSFFQ